MTQVSEFLRLQLIIYTIQLQISPNPSLLKRGISKYFHSRVGRDELAIPGGAKPMN